MKTLTFHTNIDCPLHLEKAVCGLECLRGRFCQFSVDLMEANHLLTIKTTSLEAHEVTAVLRQNGLHCVETIR